jgi:peptidoglycan/xylan/chitin deacetylase (PgdA/CDA1 family)
MAMALILTTLGVVFCNDSLLVLAANEEFPQYIEPSAESVASVKQIVDQTKLMPRSRLTKSTKLIFKQLNIGLTTTPSTNIKLSLPILMHHKTPNDFENQLQVLRAKGYQAITMRMASKILRGIEPSPTKPVVITFDDGFSDQLTAYEILKRYAMPATFYIMPGGELSQWCIGADRKNLACGDSYLNWNEIIMLSNSGLIEISSHTIDHTQLDTLSSDSKRDQILKAKQIIEQKINKEVVSFAYPYGVFDAESIQLVREAGYTSAVSTIGGIDQSTDILFELRRVRSAYNLP